MRKFLIILVVAILVIFFAVNINKSKQSKTMNPQESNIQIDPISHASLILGWDNKYIFIDPVDEEKKNIFSSKPEPDLILITDIHGDHLDVETLKIITKDKTSIVAPQAVVDQIPEELKSKVSVMDNGGKKDFSGFSIESIPMYNLPGPSEKFHTKGRGNGYVVEGAGKRVYISGDTAGIPEMRSLQNIDIAFVAMNLPYTMDPEEAANAVLDFKPKTVYPYHYRQNPTKDFADVAKFKEIVNTSNPDIRVVQVDWYPKP